MKTLLAMAMGLMGSASALAQAVPLPLEGIGGRPVPAHYARLEGSGASQTLFRILKAHQEGCAKLGKAVDLPPEGAPVSKITRDDYYTATHLIEFRREEVLSIDSNCALSWQAQTPRLIVISPQGACTLYVEKRMALGVCRAAPNAPMTLLPTLQQEILGHDSTRNCVRTAGQTAGFRSVQCVERPPEPWRSFLYRAGADRHGIVLESVVTMAPNDEVIENVRAVEVRKNITVGSDMLDLARSQGFTINLGMETRQ
jgi:hypothetical protein